MHQAVIPRASGVGLPWMWREGQGCSRRLSPGITVDHPTQRVDTDSETSKAHITSAAPEYNPQADIGPDSKSGDAQLTKQLEEQLLTTSTGGLMVQIPPANAGDTGDPGLIPESGRSPGERNGNPLQYSCLEHSTDRGAWRATIPGVTKSQTRLGN